MRVLLNYMSDTGPLEVGDVLQSKLLPPLVLISLPRSNLHSAAPNPVQTLHMLVQEGLWVLAGVPSHLGQQQQLCAI